MSMLQFKNMFLNIPKELWVSMVELSTLETFCSSCKLFNERKNKFANDLLLRLTGLSLPLEEEIFLLSKGISFFKFMCLLENKTEFHRIAPFIGKYNIKETPMPLLTNVIIPALGVQGSLRFSENLWSSRVCENGTEVLFLNALPKVTFSFKIKQVTAVFFSKQKHKYSIIDSLNDFCCFTKKEMTQTCINYTINMVLNENSANCLIPLIQNNFPVLPKEPRGSFYHTEFVSYLDLILNNKDVISLYFDVLMNPTKHVPYNNKSKLWFLYYCLFHDASSLAFKTFQMFHAAIPKDLINIVTSKSFITSRPKMDPRYV